MKRWIRIGYGILVVGIAFLGASRIFDQAPWWPDALAFTKSSSFLVAARTTLLLMLLCLFLASHWTRDHEVKE